MLNSHPTRDPFLAQITTTIEKHLADERFGVSELADAMSMSRSNLLRKVKKQTRLSVSQLIRQIRLKRGMELLRTTSDNVSEVSHQVGFSSTSYFIKCFREHYGYPPGEVGKNAEPPSVVASDSAAFQMSGRWLWVAAGGAIAIVIGLLLYWGRATSDPSLEKSIAVLPFKNDSNDSTNLYLINGLMESTLNNLQKIRDLRVISRTSSEKYRNTSLSIPEMAQELNVNYFVEGSGQKVGDQILLNIQLIEAASDRHLWAKQYRREAQDIFQLQQEIAENITAEIQAIVTPEEEKKISKVPTHNLVAYDLYLKGRHLFYQSTRESMEQAIPYFKQAVEQDPEFALAYAEAAMVCFYLDIFQLEKKYAAEIDRYADKAMLFDPNLGESLVAKALAYIQRQQYESAVPYLEKALEYNPNSGIVIHFLAEFYYLHHPNTAKYLEYALMKVRVDGASPDSVTTCHNYLQLSNAFIQAGFVEEALRYANQALEYGPDNATAGTLKTVILYATHKNLGWATERLAQLFDQDTTQFVIAQELGNFYYLARDYETSYHYYQKFLQLKEAQQLDIFRHINLKIGIVMANMGQKEKSETLIRNYKDYVDHEQTLYKHLNIAAYYSYKGNIPKVLEHLRLFSQEDDYFYWVLLLADDPVLDSARDLPEFKQLMRTIETKFWEEHKRTRATLEEKGLL